MNRLPYALLSIFLHAAVLGGVAFSDDWKSASASEEVLELPAPKSEVVEVSTTETAAAPENVAAAEPIATAKKINQKKAHREVSKKPKAIDQEAAVAKISNETEKSETEPSDMKIGFKPSNSNEEPQAPIAEKAVLAPTATPVVVPSDVETPGEPAAREATMNEDSK